MGLFVQKLRKACFQHFTKTVPAILSFSLFERIKWLLSKQSFYKLSTDFQKRINYTFPNAHQAKKNNVWLHSSQKIKIKFFAFEKIMSVDKYVLYS